MMKASLSNADPSFQAMRAKFLAQLAELRQLQAALAEWPDGRRAQKGKL
jgi:hypothetical protein